MSDLSDNEFFNNADDKVEDDIIEDFNLDKVTRKRNRGKCDFDQFKYLNVDVVETFVAKDTTRSNVFKNSSCSCAYLKKDYICHHIVGYAYR